MLCYMLGGKGYFNCQLSRWQLLKYEVRRFTNTHVYKHNFNNKLTRLLTLAAVHILRPRQKREYFGASTSNVCNVVYMSCRKRFPYRQKLSLLSQKLRENELLPFMFQLASGTRCTSCPALGWPSSADGGGARRGFTGFNFPQTSRLLWYQYDTK